MNIISLTPRQLRRAARIQETIQRLQAELAKSLNGAVKPANVRERPKPHHRVSAASRRRLAKIARARWAAAKKAGRKGL